MIVMGNLADYHGNRPLEEFSKRCGADVARLLEISPKAMPSYSTFRRTHIELNFEALSKVFSDWMSEHTSPDNGSYGVDGKRIRWPIEGENGKTRFVGLVSAFAQQQGITVKLAALREGENSDSR